MNLANQTINGKTLWTYQNFQNLNKFHSFVMFKELT